MIFGSEPIDANSNPILFISGDSMLWTFLDERERTSWKNARISPLEIISFLNAMKFRTRMHVSRTPSQYGAEDSLKSSSRISCNGEYLPTCLDASRSNVPTSFATYSGKGGYFFSIALSKSDIRRKSALEQSITPS